METYLSRLRAEFAFLEVAFGFQLQKSKMDRWDRKWVPTLYYLNATTGVRVQYEVRDGYLSTTLFRLRDGKLPERNGRVDSAEGYSLAELLGLEQSGEVAHEGDASDEQAQLVPPDFESQLRHEVRVLKEKAEPVLHGDFGLWPLLRHRRQQARRNSQTVRES